MTSEFEITEFKEKLNEFTKKGYPLLKGNPFAILSMNFSSKPFYGNIYDSEFKITKNANLNLVPYLISGTYKKYGKLTKVNYQIVPMKFGYYWIRIFPIIINLVGIIFFVANLKRIEFKTLNFTKIGLAILSAEIFLLLPLILTEIKKNKFEKEFIKSLKIKSFQG